MFFMFISECLIIFCALYSRSIRCKRSTFLLARVRTEAIIFVSTDPISLRDHKTPEIKYPRRLIAEGWGGVLV
jgi:hypothetical protein